MFSYALGSSTISLPASGGSVVFSPVMVSKSAQIDFDVSNTGTLPATIANIGVGEQNSPFSLSGLPALPVTVAPNSDVHFTIVYAPTTTGFSDGTLRLDTTVVGLTGSGTIPPPLPSYTIQGPSGNVDPQSQPAVRLSLSSVYPVAVTGTLTMSVQSDLTVDPAVQFSTGGLSVSFTVIPANSTNRRDFRRTRPPDSAPTRNCSEHDYFNPLVRNPGRWCILDSQFANVAAIQRCRRFSRPDCGSGNQHHRKLVYVGRDWLFNHSISYRAERPVYAGNEFQCPADAIHGRPSPAVHFVVSEQCLAGLWRAVHSQRILHLPKARPR